MKRPRLTGAAILAALTLTLGTSSAALAQEEPPDSTLTPECTSALADVHAAADVYNGAVAADNVAAQTDAAELEEVLNSAIEEAQAALADSGLTIETELSQNTLGAVADELQSVTDDLETTEVNEAEVAQSVLTEVEQALMAETDLNAAVEADNAAAASDAAALRVDFETAVVTARATCDQPPEVIVNNDNTVNIVMPTPEPTTPAPPADTPPPSVTEPSAPAPAPDVSADVDVRVDAADDDEVVGERTIVVPEGSVETGDGSSL